MEDILMRRLSMFAKELKLISDKSLKLCENFNIENLDAVKIEASKLKSILNRFSAELYNYFNLSKNPNADEISELTLVQLKGEETLAELNEKIKIITESITPPLTKAINQRLSVSSRLPKLDLPEFTGNILEWHQFWDRFNSNIDSRELSDVDKLMYLKASLRGEAKKSVEGLTTTNRNYQIAVLTLKQRYGKTSEIIDAHYSALYKIKAAENMDNCRKTLTEIERHLRVLNSLGENTDHNHLRFLLMEKFPEEIIYEMKLKASTDSIEDIRKQLEIIISAREDTTRIKKRSEDLQSCTVETLHNFMGYNESTKGNNISKLKTFVKDNNQFKRKFNGKATENKRKKLECIFCKDSHYNSECNIFHTLEERKAKLKDRCFNCFYLGHNFNRCKWKRNCIHCGKHHNRALCPKWLNIKKNVKTFHVTEKGSTALQTAVVKVKGQGEKFIKCRIILDSGSQRSYVTQKIAKRLNLSAEENNHLSVFTFGSKVPQEMESPLVKLTLETQNNQTKTLLANVVPTISEGVPYPGRQLGCWKSKEKYILADDGSLSDQVDILIGNDYYCSMILTEKIRIKENLYLVKSVFGWILSGITEYKDVDLLSAITYFQSSCEVRLNQPDPPLDNGNLKMLWDLESIGITDSPKLNRDEEAIKHFNENTIYENDRYSVCWPWIEYPPDLPINYGLAYGRLVNLLKRFDSKTLLSYDQTLKEQLEKGIIERVPTDSKVNHPIHYLPHHGVAVPGKPIRIVYDASSKTKDNKSLNQCLYCGPMLLEDLTGLLVKFRCHQIGLSADVEKAFLQMALQEKDRDVTRFLWIKDLTKAATQDNLDHFRFARVPFGVISSPFLLNATVKYHLMNSKEETVKQISNDIYVDNIVTGTKTTQEAIELYNKTKEAFQQISMNIRDWSSNSKDFMQLIPDAYPDKIVKILGLNWNIKDDTLHLRFNDINHANTKRGILKSIASIYDPCGYTVPSLLPAKLLLQDLWKMKVKWDAPLPKATIEKWKEILDNIEKIKEISLPRCYILNTEKNDCQLHCFTDSSKKAYAAVVYIINEESKSFVIGKSRLVPIKDQDNLKIPRLELLGVLIGSRLIQYVLKFLQLNVTQQFLWTDSQIVIDWYNSNKLLSPFVSKRIEEIKRNKNLTVRYVPSGLNPADVATRPTNSIEERGKWLSGPDFLLKEPKTWPTSSSREVSLLIGEGLLNNSKNHEQNPDPMEILYNVNENDLDSHINGLEKEKQRPENEQQDGTLSEIKRMQSEYYPNEVEGKETSLSRNLGLFKDIDNILRCKGRLKYAEWSFDKRYPILIPKDCDFTNKIINDTHVKNYHVGVNHTLSLIRQSYWIPQGKSQVQKVLKKCLRCVKHGGGPFKLPPTPALPHERVNFSMPFTFTGVDYLGPVLVSSINGTCKRWICLFTCLAVRAIHLEVVQDLTAEEGLLALRRMISTRGIPTLITSDNALHFKLMADILSNTYCVENKIRWRFIPELAPWFGGFYERLVGLVKHCMKRTLQKHLLRDSQLTTIIKEIEAVLNTRPLTCVDSEVEQVLRPSDFLNIGQCITMETTSDDPLLHGSTTKVDLVNSWKRARMILAEFKDMFCNRYLPSLRERSCHSNKEARVLSKHVPKEGQIVQIKSDNKNREGWKVGRIVSLVRGTDGLCRVAKVSVGNNIFTRSIAHLYPLEAEETEYVYEQNLHKDIAGKNLDLSNIITEDIDELENERTSSVDIVNDSTNIENKSTGMTNTDISSTDRKQSNTQEAVKIHGQSQEVRQRRNAAVRALEKIREWTHNLIVTLL